jgi:UDP-N-acetylmuramyl tripeptide synthase
MKLELDEVRRITGPNLLWDEPGAMVDVFVEEVNKQQVAECWQSWVVKFQPMFGWKYESSAFRIHEEGINLAVSAPMDALYVACDMAELAWDCCVAQTSSLDLPDWQSKVNALKHALEEEVNPDLLALMQQAKHNHVDCISDDDEVSCGMGPNVHVWPVRALPEPSTLTWSDYASIPRAFITGTNGKSTSVRLAASIAQAANIVAGVTSTDFIRVGDDIIDEGDYSGPGGARMLLRDKRTELAFLEVARGGILRRGLPVEKVNAALITNVASDHLGQYGINTVEALAQTKFVVAKGLDEEGVLVLNADNQLVVEQSRHLNNNPQLCWFSLSEQHALIQKQLANGGRAVFVRDDVFVYHHNGEFTTVVKVTEAPMTFGGSAKHNIQNALGVIGLTQALKLPLSAIQQGLKSFGSSAADNPGRGNQYEVKGVKVIVDFAHNEHSMKAVVDMVKHQPANKRFVMFGHAGDRSDQEIRDLTLAVAELEPDYYIVSEIECYLRGREIGDVPAVVIDCLEDKQISSDQVKVVGDPLQGTQYALSRAQPGDSILLFVLDMRKEIHALLSSENEGIHS